MNKIRASQLPLRYCMKRNKELNWSEGEESTCKNCFDKPQQQVSVEPEVLKKIVVEYKDGWIILLKQGDITISYPKSDVKQFIEDLSRALNGERLSTLS